MDLNDILEIEQSKYCYEQAYALHRHKEIPALFLKSEGTTFDIAGDAISGWDAVNRKFCEELFYVSSAEDSYHTGWQISMPLIYEDPVSGDVCGIFPTFGYLVLNMDPETMKPPYTVLSALEMWNDRFTHADGAWKIRNLSAKFMLGQSVWRWNPAGDTGLAVQHKLYSVPHPVLGKEGEA